MCVFVCVCARVLCSWEGEGVDEIGRDKATGVVRVRVDPRFYRPTEVVNTCTINSLLLQHVNFTTPTPSRYIMSRFLCPSPTLPLSLPRLISGLSNLTLKLRSELAWSSYSVFALARFYLQEFLQSDPKKALEKLGWKYTVELDVSRCSSPRKLLQ